IPMGSGPILAPGSPNWVRVSPDGSLTLTPPAEAPTGTWRLTIRTRTPGRDVRDVLAEVDVQGAVGSEAQRHEIDPWCEVSLEPEVPGGVAVVTVDGGRPLPPGARVETVRRGSRLRCAPIAPGALWVSSPRLLPSVRVRVVYRDGSTDLADAALRLPDETKRPRPRAGLIRPSNRGPHEQQHPDAPEHSPCAQERHRGEGEPGRVRQHHPQ